MTANGYTGSAGGGGGSVAWVDITGKPSTFAPSAHASSHASAGSDAVSLNASQITAGTLALARVPTGTTSATVALGDAPAGAVTTHVAASDPHTQYHTDARGDARYQPLDSDLTTLAGLASTSGNTIQAVSGAWASQTPAQVRTTLTLLPSILLGPVDAIPGGTPANTLVIRTT